MTAVRAHLVANIIVHLIGAWDTLVKAEGFRDGARCYSCQAETRQMKDAQSVILAKFLRCFVHDEMHPLPGIEEVKEPLLTLLSLVRRVHLGVQQGLHTRDVARHVNCVLTSLKLSDKMEDNTFSFWDSKCDTAAQGLLSHLIDRAREVSRLGINSSEQFRISRAATHRRSRAWGSGSS
jgi:hypothetical protein